ncbi:zinc ABC transporter substrate-binding protein [Spirillospora sp. NPDC047279]|uniref:metal ABC transporter solute-binding protein, Zn/Mn family n=1 Tax=Spirillospora sp. NPDC047279 TaxID=3155478 RepID=UPI0034063124
MFTSRKLLRALAPPALATAALLGLTACGDAGADSGRTSVVASFYPMAWLAGKVGGEHVEVRTLTKPGAEPHDLELTGRQIADVGDADYTVYVKGVQPAVDDAVAKHAKDKALDAASVVKTLPVAGDDREHEGEGDGHAHETEYDPHIWLDPSRMATIATTLGDRLAAADPANAAAYKANAKTVAAELTALDTSFRDGLKDTERKTIVTAHAAFGYLADRYGLKQVSIAGVDPTSEPSPKRVAELTHEVRAAGATTVFTETLVSPKVAETLAREAGVRTDVLDPVEGVAKESPDDYVSIMKRNLQTLRTALGAP